MKKFFQKLFCYKAYLETLTLKELMIECCDSKAAVYDFAYSQGRLDQMFDTGPDLLYVGQKPEGKS